jgi:hypothetical protein
VLIQQAEPPRHHVRGKPVVYARHMSTATNVYVWSNRDEVLEVTGGPVVKPRSQAEIGGIDAPVLPDDYEFGEETDVRIVTVAPAVAAWYKALWLHRLAGEEGAYNFLVLVDGYVAGLAGYSFKAIQTPYPGVDAKIWAGATILRFALGAPHRTHRTTRLVTRIALQRGSLLEVTKSLPQTMLMAAGSDKFVTTVYSRYPEAKGLRGLMKLVDRRKDARDGYRTVYWAPMGDMTAAESYARWLADETRRLAGHVVV